MSTWRCVIAALSLLGCSPSAAEAPGVDQWVAVAVRASPVDFGDAEIGRLRFRGGLALSGDSSRFGGFSGLEVLEDGRLIAVTDAGDWFEARLVLDEAGALIGLTDGRIAFMRDENGAVFPNKAAGDAEALAQLPDGRFAVAFEQTQTIGIYDLNRDGPFGAAAPGPLLAQTLRLPPNAGLEAMAADADGALIIGAEGGGGTTPLWRAPMQSTAPAPPIARYRLFAGFSLTGLDRGPDGGFFALERFFAPIVGARARISFIPAAALQAGGVIEAEELALLAPPMPLDNFEGIAAVRIGETGVRLYIISDDNHSSRQRTLLYAFDLLEHADGESAP